MSVSDIAAQRNAPPPGAVTAHAAAVASSSGRRRVSWRDSRGARRNKKLMGGLALVCLLAGTAIFAPWIAPYAPDQMRVAQLYEPPRPGLWLGADEFGRDLFSRIIYGTRISLGAAALVAGFALLLGGMLGLVAGLEAGRADAAIGAITDLLFGVPTVLLALFAAAVFGPGLRTVIIALAVVYVPQFVRVVRGATIAAAQREYVTAARAAGASPVRVAGVHILPNCVSPLIVHTATVMSLVILDEAALSFIGVGAQPPTPSWGIILRQGLDYLTRASHPAIIAGASIFIAVFAFNLLADGLRDQLDPRLRGRM